MFYPACNATRAVSWKTRQVPVPVPFARFLLGIVVFLLSAGQPAAPTFAAAPTAVQAAPAQPAPGKRAPVPAPGIAPNSSSNVNPAVAQAKKTVDAFLRKALAPYGKQASYQLGPVNPLWRLLPCQKMMAEQPPSTRLAGRVSIRVRCQKGANWIISLPADVHIQVMYLAATRPLRTGDVLTEKDFTHAPGDLASLPPTVVLDPKQALGYSLKTNLGLAQPIPAAILRPPSTVAVHQPVKVVYKNLPPAPAPPGTIPPQNPPPEPYTPANPATPAAAADTTGASGATAGASGAASANPTADMTEGTALNHAGEGEPVRVQLRGGGVVQGLARPGGIVEVP